MDSFQEILLALERPKRRRNRKRNKKKSPEAEETQPAEGTEKMEKVEKTKEEILAERKAKKEAKKAKTAGNKEVQPQPVALKPPAKVADEKEKAPKEEKSREEILKERELKKLSKQSAKKRKLPESEPEPVSQDLSSNNIEPTPLSQSSSFAPTVVHNDSDLMQYISDLSLEESKSNATQSQSEVGKKPALTKAERRAIQEAQRAAKAKAQAEKAASAASAKKASAGGEFKVPAPKPTKSAPAKAAAAPPGTGTSEKASVHPILHKVKLFNHLYTEKRDLNAPVNSKVIHPAIIRLGVQYATGKVVGSNARCLAFLLAVKELIEDFETPEQKEFSRGLEAQLTPCFEYLKECRQPSVSMINALRYIKWQITLLKPENSDSMNREILVDSIETYIRDQIEKAAQAISNFVQEKISDGDVILTYGSSSLLRQIIETAHERQVNFRVVIVDSLPRNEGQQMLMRLVAAGIQCTFVLISAVSFIMPEVTKCLLGAHALLANGYVMSRVGAAQIAMVAKAFNVPVLVCCETHKFSERVQTDAFVYNEIGDPDELVQCDDGDGRDTLANWENIPHLTPLNLKYDVTPPELVTAVVTEIGILPCSSAPVILRIKPSEIGY